MSFAGKLFGANGEELAESYFIERGFSVVGRNWSCPSGEIDLIVEKEGVTHFVEVKARHTLEFGYPEESITPKKLSHLRRAIETYLNEFPNPPDRYQADALAILMLSGKEPQYRHVEYIL